jgi:hypothetical protein
MNDKPNARYRHLYAVLRLDLPIDTEYPENSITVVKVFMAKTQATQEVARLNKLKFGGGSRYHLQITRLFPAIN